MSEDKCFCCSENDLIGEYVGYCNKVTEKDIENAIVQGAETIQEVIRKTGAMKDSNCAINNPKGTCCYADIILCI